IAAPSTVTPVTAPALDNGAKPHDARHQLKDVAKADLAEKAAYLYDYVNFAYPFREGNGRSTREFFDLLLSERGAGLDWQKTDLIELHDACHTARAESDLSGLTAMFAKILDDGPAYEF
ncbi:MAG: Fic family protein, partial [Mycobacterium sp.]